MYIVKIKINMFVLLPTAHVTVGPHVIVAIEAKTGATTCPECNAQFEIDDRLECVFGDTGNLRLSAIGTICASCGLIQAGSHQNCLY